MGDTRFPKDDDHLILSTLTQSLSSTPSTSTLPSKSNLSPQEFTDLRNRLISDHYISPVSGTSNGSFWQEVISKTSRVGFTFQPHKDSSNSQADIVSADSFPAPFDTEIGKKHLEAASALLGVTKGEAMRLTNNIFCLEKEKLKSGSGGNEHGDLQKSIGTKRLLLLVRDYHYAQKLCRLQVVTEAIRLECAYDDYDEEGNDNVSDNAGNKKKHRDLCIAFLNDIDAMDSWTSSSREHQGQGQEQSKNRGLFRLLVSIACAPVKMVGREEIHRACELSDSNDESQAGVAYSSANPDFARDLMAVHFAHADLRMRTEALEALFVLLYQRIDGGIDRGEYVLLLQALGIHSFFANEDAPGANDDDGSGCVKRRSQLTALILAECMGLWRTAGKNAEDGEESWVDSHPFLSNPAAAKNEIELIGKILLDGLANNALERRRICMMQSTSVTDASRENDDDKIEVPEAIALLTFGLLVKLAHSHCVGMKEANWASDEEVKALAVECVSKANDDCGAFGYLRHVMDSLLVTSSSSAMGVLESGNSMIGLEPNYDSDYNALMLRGPNEDGPLRITESEKGELNAAIVKSGDEPSVVYASIGREILVSTLSAFRSSLSRNLSSSKVDNLGMFCHLASNIHRNSHDLCHKFWGDWESTPQAMDLSENTIISANDADPLVYLLDIAHSVAIDALAKLGSDSSGDNFISTDCGRQEAAMLPCFSPLLSMLSSLIPLDSDVATIMETFIPNELLLSCLRGAYHICSEINAWSGSEENNRLVEAARKCIESVRILSSIAMKQESKDCADWLRDATHCHVPTSNLHGAYLLQRIAEAACENPAMTKSDSVNITSDALYTIAHLCSPSKYDQKWIMKVGKSFSCAHDDKCRLFAAHINEITVSFTFLLRQLSLCVSDVSLNTEGVSEDELLDFMSTSKNGNMLACDIISSSAQSLDLSGTHQCILVHAFNIITTTLRIMSGIASCHSNESVRNAAISIRNDIVNALATSTSLGSNIGFYATMPVLKEIIETGRSGPSLSLVTNTRFNLEEKKESHCASIPIEELSFPTKCEEQMVTLSDSATSLLKAWSDVVERVAIERIDVSTEQGSFATSLQRLPLRDRAPLATIIVSLGPSRLLFSSAPQPAEPNTTLIALLTRIAVWFVEGPKQGATNFGDIAILTIDLIKSIVLHSKLDESNAEFNLMLTSLESFQYSFGVKLHKMLLVLINTGTESMCHARSLMMIKSLELLSLCISYCPFLGNLILQGDKNENSILVALLDKINIDNCQSYRGAIVTSACLNVFKELWESCRNHCSDSSTSLLVRSIHPSDDAVRTLVKENRVIKEVISLLESFTLLLGQNQEGQDLNELSMYHRCTLLDIMCSATKMIEIDASCYLRGVNRNTNAESINFLNKFAAGNGILQWLQTIEKYDGLTANVKFGQNFNSLLQSSKTALSSVALNDTVAARFLLDNPMFESIHLSLAPFDASCRLVSSQSNLLLSVSSFGELISRQDSTNVEKMMNLAEQAAKNLSKVAENGLAAHSESITTDYSVPVSQTLICGNALLTYFLSCLSKVANPDVTKEFLVQLLDKLLRASERFLVLVNSTSDNDGLDMNMRLNASTCAISLMNMLMNCANDSLSYESSQLFRATRLGMCQFSSETLNMAKSVKRGEQLLDSPKQTLQTGPRASQSSGTVELNAVHSSISLLTVVVIASGGNQDQSLSQQSFHFDLTETFKNNHILELLSDHLEMASNDAAEFYRHKEKWLVNKAAFETVQQIISFASVLCNDRGSILSELVTNSRFVQLMLNNPILRTACEKWTPNSQQTTSFDKTTRGYVENPVSDLSFASTSHPHMMEDPAHGIWRATLQTITGLLHSTNMDVLSTYDSTKTREHAANIAIDFLHFYEIPILTFLEQYLTPSQQESTTTHSSTPSSGLNFTAATMGELRDILALVSELCSENHGKQFKACAPNLYEKMSRVALVVCRTLSLFLGALGSAREIFTVLNQLNDVMGKDMNQSATALQYQSSSNHPLLADGVNNAKHQAIRNALYASGCCSFMTAKEYALSPLGQPKANQDAPLDLENAFHSHVSNGFIYCMEDLASQCMVCALSIMHKVHPSTSAFVVFSEHEAAQLNLSSSPPIGAMVAIRSGAGAQSANRFLSPAITVRYGRVIHYNAIARTFDVEYFDKHGLSAERHVTLSRLAALEDISKRVSMLTYKAAPESVSDNATNFASETSIGNLMLIVRWCKQHASSKDSILNGGRPSLQVKSVASLASIILGDELSIHLELGSPTSTTEQEVKKINIQLLNLFDNEASLQNFDLSASKASASKVSFLEKIVDKNVWESIQLQLESFLMTARADRKIALKIATEQGGTSQYWARTPQGSHTRSSRRSPFC